MKFADSTTTIHVMQSTLNRALRDICLIILFAINGVTLPSAYASNNEDDGFTLKPLIVDIPASWAIKVSPNNFLFVTHKNGSLAKYSLSGDLLTTAKLALDDLYIQAQGGLSDIVFHPDFEEKPWVYLSYSFGDDNANGLKVIRVLLKHTANDGFAIAKQESIFEQVDLRSTAVHYGARLAFMDDKSLLITTGDGFDYREQAQKIDSDMGKILRLSDTGSIPNDNPFASADTFTRQATYSLGHRNPQGLVVLPSGIVVSHEHGPDGGDEINIIKRGKNYGWPVITLGKDYIGSLITPFTEYAGMEQPTVDWTPSIAPSAMAFYASHTFPSLTNSLLVTSLKFKQLHALTIQGDTIGKERIFFADSQHRMRDVTVSNDGRIFILSDRVNVTVFEVVAQK